jgi:hypothetical protein
LARKKMLLLPAESVFKAADSVLNLSLDLIRLALGLQLGVTNRLADGLFDGAFDLLRRSDDAVLVHDFSSSATKAPWNWRPIKNCECKVGRESQECLFNIEHCRQARALI